MQYEAMLSAQGGLCAICRKVNSDGRRLVVDHNHATKEVRGLLCSNCNRGIGCFQDSPILLTATIEYLKNKEIQHGNPCNPQ